MNNLLRFIIATFFLVSLPNVIFSASLSGKVVDSETGDGLPGVTIRIENSAFGSVSKAAGKFTIPQTPSGNIEIIVSMIGYEAQRIKMNSVNDKEILIKLVKQDLKLDEVVVSANKKAQSAQEVPISIAIMDRAGLINRGITKLDDALRYMPGVEINRDNVSIRGSSGFSFGVGTRVTMLLDGIPMIAGDNGDIKFDAMPMFNVQRVEVVKGAGSALYGTSALGGVVNLITEEPSANGEFKLRTFSGYYTQPRFESWKYTDDPRFNSGINLSYSQKIGDLGVIGSGAYYNDNSYTFYNDSYRWNIFTKLNYHVSDNNDVSVLFNGAEEDHTDWAYWKSLDSATVPPDGTDLTNRFKSLKYSAFGSWRSILGDYSYMELKSGIMYTDYSNTLPDTSDSYRQSIASAINTDLQFNGKLAEDLAITYGLNHSYTSVTARTYGNHDQQNFAGYMQFEFNGVQNLISTFGLRVDYEDAPGIDTKPEFSPKVGFSYAITPDFNLRASAGHGFRTASVAERYSTIYFNGFNVYANPQLKSESSWSGELGGNWKTEIFDTPIYFDASVFQNEFYDLIEPTFLNNGSADIKFQNITRARIQGAELDIKTLLFGRFGVETSVTAMNPIDLSTNSTLKYRSKFLWQNRFSLPLSFVELQADYRFKSKIENVDEFFLSPVSPAKDAGALVEIHVLDVRAIFDLVKSNSLDLTGVIFAKNVLDYYYVEMVSNLSPTRQIGLQIDAKF